MAACKEDLEWIYLTYRQSACSEDLTQVMRAGERLVRYFARIYTGGVSDDTLQVGMVGLMKAVRHYDEEKGASFSTYAAHCVMGEIRHYIRKEASFYRPGSIKDLQNRVDRYVEDVLKEKGEPPALAEIALALNVKEEGVIQAMRAGLVSLDDVDVKQIQALKYESFRLPIEDKILLQQAMNRLDTVQKKVIYLLFYRDFTQTQAGEQLGLSQRKVSRILRKSLQKLADIMKL